MILSVKRTRKGPLRGVLARNMRRLRAARGLSQEALAHESGAGHRAGAAVRRESGAKSGVVDSAGREDLIHFHASGFQFPRITCSGTVRRLLLRTIRTFVFRSSQYSVALYRL